MKGLSYPGGGNPPPKTGLFGAKRPQIVLLMSVIGALLMLSSQAFATIYVDDFEYDKPATDVYNNGRFHHVMQALPQTVLSWDITTTALTSPGINHDALALWPGRDVITFNLGPNERVNYVSVDYIDWGGDTSVKIIDENGSFIISDPATPNFEYSINTAGSGLTNIETIILRSYEGGFDNVTIHVEPVPEPATLGLISLGCLLLRRRRA
jgi:hypothetical protein